MANNSIFINQFRGINESVDTTMLDYREASYARNCDTHEGVLSSINSSDLYTALDFPYGIGSIMGFYKNNEEYILIASGSTLYEYHNGTLKTIKTSLQSDKFDYININYKSEDMIMITNGIDDVMIYNGIEIRHVRNRGYIYNRDVDGNVTTRIINEIGQEITEEQSLTTHCPKGKLVELHYERVWISGNLGEPNRVYFSTANTVGFDIEDWTIPTEENEANQHGGFVDIPTYDGGQIIGLKTIFNDVMIFKTHTIHRIFGTNPENYQIEQVFASNGAISDKSIVSAGNIVYFADIDGIYIFDGTNVKKISDKIKKTWKSFTREQLKNCVGTHKDNTYILSIPQDNKSLIIEYNEVADTFMICEDKTTHSFLKCNDGILFENLNKIYNYKKSNNTVSAKWVSGLYDMNAQHARKNTEYLYFIGNGNGDIKVTCETDRMTKSIIITLTETDKAYRKKLKVKGRLIQITFENINNSRFVIKKPSLTVELDID